MVGFNRRFAPLFTELQRTASAPATAARSPRATWSTPGGSTPGSWYLNEELEGSRFAGEGGHFIDTLSALVGHRPGRGARGRHRRRDVHVTLRFADGSVGTITYVTERQRALPEGDLDVTGGGRNARLDNFRRVTVWSAEGKDGQARAGRAGQGPARPAGTRSSRPSAPAAPMPIALDSLVATTRATLAVEEQPVDRAAGGAVSTAASAGTRAGSGGCRRRGGLPRRATQDGAGAWARRQVLPGAAPPPARGRWPAATLRVAAAARSPATQVPAEAARGVVVAAADRILAGDWDGARRARAGQRRPRLVPRPGDRRGAPRTRRYAFRIDHRDEAVDRQRQAGLGDVAAPPPHRAGGRLVADRRRAVRRRPSPTSCGPGGAPTRSCPACTGPAASRSGIRLIVLGLDPPAARRLAGGRRPVRERRRRRAPDPLAPGVPRRVPQPRLVGQQPRRSPRPPGGSWPPAPSRGSRRATRWRARRAPRCCERELAANTFPSGLNRELATRLPPVRRRARRCVAAVEADAAGHPLGDGHLGRCSPRSLDAAAALLDVAGAAAAAGRRRRGPRRCVLDDPSADPLGRRCSAPGRALRRAAWTGGRRPRPSVAARRRSARSPDRGTRSAAGPRSGRDRVRRRRAACCCARRRRTGRRSGAGATAGPHGFLSIAAHAHADALSIEVRHDGVDDPRRPRHLLLPRRAGVAELLPVDRRPQHDRGRRRRPVGVGRAVPVGVAGADVDDRLPARQGLGPQLDGAARRLPAAARCPSSTSRQVALDSRRRRLTVVDTLETAGEVAVRLSWHLGPDVSVELDGARARLSWSSAGEPRTAVMTLPAELDWSRPSGELDPPSGWYSPGLRAAGALVVAGGPGTGVGREPTGHPPGFDHGQDEQDQ